MKKKNQAAVSLAIKIRDERIIDLAIESAALRLGCERALELLQDPNAEATDATKVERLLETVLRTTKNEK